jgi:uncharacterized protein
MRHDGWLLLPLAVGHVALFALVLNILHGLGHPEHRSTRVKLGFLVTFTLVSGVLAWEAWNGSWSAWSWPTLLYGAACVAMAFILFPIATAYLHLRPTPSGIRGRESIVDLAAMHGSTALTGNGKYAWMLKLAGNQSFHLRVVDWEVPVAGLPSALDGLSILHLSDLHLARSFDRGFFEEVFERAASLPSDLVVFTGDLIDDDGAVDWIVPLFSKLRGRLGSFAILGNHDLSHAPERLRGLLVAAGLIDLEGAWATVQKDGQMIALGGTSYPWGPALSLLDRPRADLSIYLSHTPDLFYQAERDGFDLMLSGHNHGGQIRFPLIGPVFMPSRYSRRFDRGFFRKNGLTLHVSQGIAGKHPMRYGCLPEIGRLFLRAVESESSAIAKLEREAAHESLRSHQ